MQNIIDRRNYNLLKALQNRSPHCQVLKDEIAPIEEAHSWEWQDPLLAGLVFGETMIWHEDPFTTAYLRETAPAEIVDRLLECNREAQPRELIQGLHSVQEATQEKFQRGYAIAEELARRGQWSEPVWRDIIAGWRYSDLNVNQWQTALGWFSSKDVYKRHAGEIAESLQTLTRNGGKVYAGAIIEQAEKAALPLWKYLRCDESPLDDGWHDAAFNRYQVGYLARFWMEATAIRNKVPETAGFSATCLAGLRQIINDNSLKGGLGIAVLSGQTDFLYQIDRHWSDEEFRPIFDSGGIRERAALGGLVEAQNITRSVAQEVGPDFHQKFTDLVERSDAGNRTKRLLTEAYTKLLCHYAPQPAQWLRETITRCDVETATLIAESMKSRLREADAEQRRYWWTQWMRQYWHDRKMGAPKPIDPAEGLHFIGWIAQLPEVFQEAAALAKSTPWNGPDDEFFIAFERSEAVDNDPNLTADLMMEWSNRLGITSEWASAHGILTKIVAAGITEEREKQITGLKERIRSVAHSLG